MPKKFTYKDVPKEWKEQVKARAIEQEVDEDSVIRYGLHYDFKKERAEAGYKKELKTIQKENEKTLKDILKELKK